MRDGIKLATDVYLNTAQTTPHGAILMRTPYNKFWTNRGGWANLGWPSIVQDMRGRFASEGVDTVFRNAHTDGPDTLAWIANQSWSNGKIATYGGSALGINQYYMAGANPTNLSCQYIRVATPDMHKHAIYQGGQFRKNMIEKWLNAQGSSFVLPELWEHENYTLSYWTNTSLDGKWQNVNVPAIHVGGWYDCFSQGTIDGFMGYQYLGGPGAKGKSKLVMGPWTHGGSQRNNQGELTYPDNSKDTFSGDMFWDMVEQFTMNGPKVFENYSNVSYYVMGDVTDQNAPGNEWRYADAWPVPANYTPFYLHENELLSGRIPVLNHSENYSYDPTDPGPTLGGQNLNLASGPYDQSSIETRDDVLVFTSPNLTKPVEATGPIKARLFVSSDCVDTDFTVKLSDVYPDGRSMLITDGILRMRNRNGRDHWAFMEPGEVYDVEVDLWSTSYIWNTSHRIRVAISSSNYPRFLANPNTADGIYKNSTYNVAKNTVYMNFEQPSCIILPIVGEKYNEEPTFAKPNQKYVMMNEDEVKNFTVLVSDEDIVNISYTWTLDDIVISGWNQSYYEYYADFNSSGHHKLNITVFDSGFPSMITYHEFNITVKNVNRLPVVISYSPAFEYTTNEKANGTIDFSINAIDPDIEDLTYHWYLDDKEMVSKTNTSFFNYNFSSAGKYNVKVKIKDPFDRITLNWNITINDINRAPTIISYSPSLNCSSFEQENGKGIFHVTAADPDLDTLSYTWYLNTEKVENQQYSIFELPINYSSAGYYVVEVVVNDSMANCSVIWHLTISNKNRIPIITSNTPDGNLEMSEQEIGSIEFSITAVDPDNDPLQYSWYVNSVRINNANKPIFLFQYNFTSAGEYKIMVKVNDSMDEVYYIWNLLINNVNHPPLIKSFSPMNDPTINDNDTKPISFIISAIDIDSDDELNYKWYLDYHLLVGFENATYTFSPIKGQSGEYTIKVEVSDGKSGIASQKWNLKINRTEPHDKDLDKDDDDDDTEKNPQTKEEDSLDYLIWGIFIIIVIFIILLSIFIFLNKRKLRRNDMDSEIETTTQIEGEQSILSDQTVPQETILEPQPEQSLLLPENKSSEDQPITQLTQSLCTTCGQPLSLISENDKYFCYQCQKYE
jgi:predicted acyl esterase